LWSDTQLAMGEADEALAFADGAVARFEATPAEAEVGVFVSGLSRRPDPVGRRIRTAVTDFHRDTVIKELA